MPVLLRVLPMSKAKPSASASSSANLGFEAKLRFAAVFGKHVKPLLSKIRSNFNQSHTLATRRDTQRPKLLSGELSVGGLQDSAFVKNL